MTMNPLAGQDGFDELKETIAARIQYARVNARLDEANIWNNYLYAVEAKYITPYTFDVGHSPTSFAGGPEALRRLRLFGGWTQIQCC